MSSTVIEASGLEYRYSREGELSLSLSSLSISRGERVFVQGASGNGKSTLLGLLAGILPCQNGTLHMLDRDLGGMRAHQRDQFRADHIGYIFQQFNLVPYLDMVENVTLPCRFSAVRRARSGEGDVAARALLASFGLGEELYARPVTQLSVGQQQRVAAARAMIGSPEILLADEPTSALDQAHRQAFLDNLFRVADERHMTVVFVSHDAGLEPLFSRSVHLTQPLAAAG